MTGGSRRFLGERVTLGVVGPNEVNRGTVVEEGGVCANFIEGRGCS